MSWPKKFKGGRTIKTPVNSIDILPTVIDAVGAKLQIPHSLMERVFYQLSMVNQVTITRTCFGTAVFQRRMGSKTG